MWLASLEKKINKQKNQLCNRKFFFLETYKYVAAEATYKLKDSRPDSFYYLGSNFSHRNTIV